MKLKTILITLLSVVVVLTASIIITKNISSTLVVTRTFNASVEKAFFIWSNESSIENWWGAQGATNLSIENDFRPGGKFLFTTHSASGVILTVTGKYSEIVPNQKIVSSIQFADASGQVLESAQVPLPGKWLPGILKVEFRESGKKVQIKLTQTGIPLLMKPVAEWQWNQQLDKFSKLVYERH